MKIKLVLTSLIAFFSLLFACQPKADKNNSSANPSEEVYLKKGSEIAGATFAVLSSQLKNSLQSGGVAGAVQYCNLAAIPLVDSLSRTHQAKIRRTSMKVRNPKNQATLEEKLILQAFEKNTQEGKALEPMVRTIDEKTIAFYAPIQTIAFCLQCHGKVGETLKTEDYAQIQALYPNDQAIDYEEGDLRGMWSIQFVIDSGQ